MKKGSIADSRWNGSRHTTLRWEQKQSNAHSPLGKTEYACSVFGNHLWRSMCWRDPLTRNHLRHGRTTHTHAQAKAYCIEWAIAIFHNRTVSLTYLLRNVDIEILCNSTTLNNHGWVQKDACLSVIHAQNRRLFFFLTIHRTRFIDANLICWRMPWKIEAKNSLTPGDENGINMK